MKGYCKVCGKLIDETEIKTHICKKFNKVEYIIKHDGVITTRKIKKE